MSPLTDPTAERKPSGLGGVGRNAGERAERQAVITTQKYRQTIVHDRFSFVHERTGPADGLMQRKHSTGVGPSVALVRGLVLGEFSIWMLAWLAQIIVYIILARW